MKWTVGQRIAVGYAVILMLLAVVAGVGMYALPRATDTFSGAVRQQEQSLRAMGADERLATATANFLRFLLNPDPKFLKARRIAFRAAARPSQHSAMRVLPRKPEAAGRRRWVF